MPAVVDDGIHRYAGVRRLGARSAAAAADDFLQLVAEHAPAHRVQEEVDREAGDVQRLAVVADDRHLRKKTSDVFARGRHHAARCRCPLEFADDRQRLARDGDEPGQLDLPHDEVQQDRAVGEHVARRDEDQDDGQLAASSPPPPPEFSETFSCRRLADEVLRSRLYRVGVRAAHRI